MRILCLAVKLAFPIPYHSEKNTITLFYSHTIHMIYIKIQSCSISTQNFPIIMLKATPAHTKR